MRTLVLRRVNLGYPAVEIAVPATPKERMVASATAHRIHNLIEFDPAFTAQGYGARRDPDGCPRVFIDLERLERPFGYRQAVQQAFIVGGDVRFYRLLEGLLSDRSTLPNPTTSVEVTETQMAWLLEQMHDALGESKATLERNPPGKLTVELAASGMQDTRLYRFEGMIGHRGDNAKDRVLFGANFAWTSRVYTLLTTRFDDPDYQESLERLFGSQCTTLLEAAEGLSVYGECTLWLPKEDVKAVNARATTGAAKIAAAV